MAGIDAVQAAVSAQPMVAGRLAVLANRPPQCILLEGGSAEERFAFSLYWAMLLNCMGDQRPCYFCHECRQVADRAFNDLLIFDAEEGNIPVQEIRDTRPVWGQPPNGEGHRVTIFNSAYRLNVEAANTLLKTLEEPRPGNVFVLTAPQRERLLETLVSRSFVITLSWPDKRRNEPEVDEWTRALAGFWRSGRAWFPRTSAKGAVDKELAIRVVLGMQRELREAMSSQSTPLSQELAQTYGLRELRRIDLTLAKAQEALNTQTPVNPAMVLDWVATRMI